MKKLLLSLLALFMVITLVGCKREPNEPTNKNEKETTDNIETIKNDVINCENCVFAYYNEEKNFDDILDNYTKDYKTLKDDKGNQRNNFMGHVIDENGKIQSSYVCGIENEKVFCLTGLQDASAFNSNMNILNQVFNQNQCRRVLNGKTYNCSGNIIAELRNDGYVSIRNQDNCYVFGRTKKMNCTK